MAWTKLKIAVGVGVAGLLAYQWHLNADQTKQISALRGQLQAARQQAETEQTAIDELKQEKLAMTDEKQAAKKLLANQRTALAAAAAKKAAAGSNSYRSALGKVMDDPMIKEFMLQQQLSKIKNQYAPLVKSLKLTPEAADKFMQLLTDNATKNMELGMGLMKGDADAATTTQAKAEAKNELSGQLQALLGPDGYAQYDAFTQDLPAKAMLGLLQGQMVDNPLSEDQSARLLQLLKSGGPKSDDLDSGSSSAAIEQYLQQQADHNQQLLQQAAEFLSPEQLAAVGTFQTNMMNMQKMGLSMKDKLAGSKAP